MLEFRIRHWLRLVGATSPVASFNLLNCQRTEPLRIADPLFRISQFEIRNPFVELIGIEPTTSWLQTRRSPKLSYSPAAVNSRTA
jgi:hypothetical protein